MVPHSLCPHTVYLLRSYILNWYVVIVYFQTKPPLQGEYIYNIISFRRGDKNRRSYCPNKDIIESRHDRSPHWGGSPKHRQKMRHLRTDTQRNGSHKGHYTLWSNAPSIQLYSLQAQNSWWLFQQRTIRLCYSILFSPLTVTMTHSLSKSPFP